MEEKVIPSVKNKKKKGVPKRKKSKKGRAWGVSNRLHCRIRKGVGKEGWVGRVKEGKIDWREGKKRKGESSPFYVSSTKKNNQYQEKKIRTGGRQEKEQVHESAKGENKITGPKGAGQWLGEIEVLGTGGWGRRGKSG